MTNFEIEIYRLVNDRFKGVSNKLTFPQILTALGKQDAPLAEKAEISTILHDADFQRVLQQVGTLLFVGRDGLFRIIDSFSMKHRQDVGKRMCRLCLIEEDDAKELVHHDDESWVHPLCQGRFQKLQRCRAREVKNV